MTLFKIIKSVLSSFIGIQINSRLNEDNNIIEDKGVIPYLVVGFFLAIVFIILIITVVTLIID